MLVREEQKAKAKVSITVTDCGMLMLVRAEQKAYLQLVVCQLILAEMVEK